MNGVEPTIVIADDHQVTRLGVRMALMRGGFHVVGEAVDRDGTVSAVLRERPDVCLLDIRMPGGGIETARQLGEAAPSTSVVMLTVSTDTDDVLASLRAGAVGYLPKDTSPDRLPAALCGVLKGEAALPRTLVGRVLQEFRAFTDGAVAHPVRVGKVQLTTEGVGDPADARLGADDRRGGGDPVALADHRSPPHIRRSLQARRGRPGRRDPRDRAHRRLGISAARKSIVPGKGRTAQTNPARTA